MKVRRLNSDNDWTFGQGFANYLDKGDAVLQNVITRVKSFKNDWFLDVEAEIDWLNLLGNKNTKDIITSEVERVVLSTDGVKQIINLNVVINSPREVSITIEFDTIFNKKFLEQIGIAA